MVSPETGQGDWQAKKIRRRIVRNRAGMYGTGILVVCQHNVYITLVLRSVLAEHILIRLALQADGLVTVYGVALHALGAAC